MKRILTIDVETHPRFDSLDCFAYINGQSYRLVTNPDLDRHSPNINRPYVVKTLRKFADYIEKAACMTDDLVFDERGDVRRWYREGRLSR